jgi:hypothetical protein
MSYRLMVVGSAAWEEDAVVHRELSKVHDSIYDPTNGTGVPITLVTVGTGGHGKGAEAMAISVAGDLGWDVELHPPKWDQFGQSPYLSAVAELVDTRPHLCLAFIEQEDDIADIGAGMAETVDIQVLRYRETQW